MGMFEIEVVVKSRSTEEALYISKIDPRFCGLRGTIATRLQFTWSDNSDLLSFPSDCQSHYPWQRQVRESKTTPTSLYRKSGAPGLKLSCPIQTLIMYFPEWVRWLRRQLVIYCKVTPVQRRTASPSLDDGNNRYSDTDIPLIFRIPVLLGKLSERWIICADKS